MKTAGRQSKNHSFPGNGTVKIPRATAASGGKAKTRLPRPEGTGELHAFRSVQRSSMRSPRLFPSRPLLRGEGKTETDKVGAVVRPEAAPGVRAAAHRAAEPTAAPRHAVRTLQRSTRVFHLPIFGVVSKPILHPFPDIPVHVIQTMKPVPQDASGP
jgi:hypothetical protein